MKQKLTILILSILCLCLLAGCECKHEWTEADCLNPKVCTKCDVTEGEALGHDWQDATCQAPKTCGRCGVTEGEVSEHSYGSWAASGEGKMERACTVCGSKETQKADQAVLIPELLKNTHWVGSHLVREGKTYYLGDLATASPQYAEDLKYKIDFNGGDGFNLVLGQDKPYYGTWEYLEQTVTDSSSGHHLALKDVESNKSVHAVLFDQFVGVTVFQISLDIGNGITLFFEQDYPRMVTGTWAPFWIADELEKGKQLEELQGLDEAGGIFTIDEEGNLTVSKGGVSATAALEPYAGNLQYLVGIGTAGAAYTAEPEGMETVTIFVRADGVLQYIQKEENGQRTMQYSKISQ